MDYTFAGHIGEGSIRLIPLVDFEAPNAANKIFELSERVNDLVLAFGGTISCDHNDGLIRSYFLKNAYGEELVKVFERVKEILDPQNIFNPGKKVHADRQFALEHLSKTNTPKL
jgi:FAD/FMN-containing dehydrogenase